MKRINKDDNNSSQILEMRINFISSCRFMSYKHYLQQKLTTFQTKLNQILYRDPTLVNQLNSYLLYPLKNHYDHIPFNN